MNKKVVVIDYGIGNLLSVKRGFEVCRGSVIISSDPQTIANADRLVLPGVGAFKDGMEGLRQRSFLEPIKSFTKKERPLLGICLGMQMLMEASSEFGHHDGLSLIPGKVVVIPAGEHPTGGIKRKIPHIGWCALKPNNNKNGWQSDLLSGVRDGEFFYFVHSFMAVPDQDDYLIGYCEYQETEVNAVIQRNMIMGTQFHPEKSGEAGLRILENFLEM